MYLIIIPVLFFFLCIDIQIVRVNHSGEEIVTLSSPVVTHVPAVQDGETADPEVGCTSLCDIDSSIVSETSKVLVTGASSFIGSSIALHLHRNKFNVLPIETDDVHLLSSSGYHNWEQMSSEKLEPIVVQSSEIKSLIEELENVDQVIHVPRKVFGSILENNIFKQDGIADLEILVNLLEAIKNHRPSARITLITKPEDRLSSMQSAWLKTLENSLKTYYSLYEVNMAFVRIEDGGEYNADFSSTIQCIVASPFTSKCFDIGVAVKPSTVINAMPSTKMKNIQQNNVVMSTYFTTIQNPQYAITIAKNTFKFMQDWLVSASRLGIRAIIFHDSLSDNFISRVKKIFDNVVFEKVGGFAGRTPNDYRFYLQYKYLQDHPEINNVIISDIRDITFFNDPFEVMDVLGGHIYVGVDVSYYTNSWSHAYPRGIISACYRKYAHSITVTSDPFYNAGVIGATRQLMLKFLKHATASLNGTPRGRNCNMATVTVVIHESFRDEAFSGYPFQSAFKMDIPGPQGLAVKHKIEHKNL